MKLDIRQRVQMVTLSGAILTFIGFSLIGAIAMIMGGDKAAERGRLLEESVVGFVESFSREQTRQELVARVTEKAGRVEISLESARRDVRTLADAMTSIMTRPGDYLPRQLPDPRREEILSGQPYLHFSEALASEGLDEALRQEMAIAGNAANSLQFLSQYYSGVFVGSKNGWLAAADRRKAGSAIEFTDKFLKDYDPRTTIWYRKGLGMKPGDDPVFTELYVDNNAILCSTCMAPFYDADGFAGVVGLDYNADVLYKILLSVSGQEDVFVLNHKGEIMFSTMESGTLAAGGSGQDIRSSGEKSLAFETASMVAGKNDVALVTVDGNEYFLAYAPLESFGWSVGLLMDRDTAAYPVSFARDTLLLHIENFVRDFSDVVRLSTAVGAALLCLLIGAIYVLSSRVADHFVKPILALTEGVKEIAQGNLDRKLEISTGDEIENLADSVNAMQGDLKTYMRNLAKVTADKEHIETELSVAHRIQAAMMPRLAAGFSGQRGFDLAASMIPAKQVGGDFYDYYWLDDHHLVITVADVSGKGVPASLFMVVSKTVLENYVMAEGIPCDLAAAAAKANDRLCDGNDHMMFVTAFTATLDLRTGALTYVNMGHNPPILARGRDDISYLLPEGKPDKSLGVFEGISFHQHQLTLSPGDMLFLYTDGITEAVNEETELFGEERLKEVFRALGNERPMKEMLDGVHRAVKEFAGTAEQADDMTMLGIRYLGK